MVLPLRSPPDADPVRRRVRLRGGQCLLRGPGAGSPTAVIGPSPSFLSARKPPWADSLHAMRLTPGGIALQSP